MASEAQTRKEHIDAKLFAAGWDVNNLAQVVQEYGYICAAGSGGGGEDVLCWASI